MVWNDANASEGRGQVPFPVLATTEARLVVVGDENLAERLGGILGSVGLPLQTLPGGVRAVSYIDACRPLLVILAHFAHQSSFEICRRLRRNERTRDIPVLFIAANPEEEAEAFQAGVSDVIPASLPKETVLARVRLQLELVRHRA